MFGESFDQLMVESYLASSSLGGGLTALGKCRYHDRGSFYSSFFQLSIGLERLFKIIFIINHMVENDLDKPDYKTLKKFSHNISDIHKHCAAYGSKFLPNFNWELNWQQNLIITLLSEFAEASRYYNMDKMVKGKKETNDPLPQWNEVINSCFRKHISEKKKQKFETELNVWAEKNHAFNYTWNKGLDGHLLSQIDEYILNWKVIHVTPYITFEIVSMLEPYYHLMIELKNAVDEIEHFKGIRDPLVPYIHEIFVFFLVPKHLALRRKIWSHRY
ncbi:hypothetical protein [Pseudescherichia sp.]|uniref:hypothetical protein n=1 Tax=Pseudescherichia sp. TaxID=2055881 RepID=UPI00289DA9AB|nr:hypothetical protein [Pseudescherichia sp.]